MSGLSLMGQAGFSGSMGALPAAANTPTGLTISQQAFGVSTGLGTGPRTAGYGTLIAGAAATVLLAWMWWTLPR